MSSMHKTINTKFSPDYCFPTIEVGDVGILKDGTGGTDHPELGNRPIAYVYLTGFHWYPNHRIYE